MLSNILSILGCCGVVTGKPRKRKYHATIEKMVRRIERVRGLKEEAYAPNHEYLLELWTLGSALWLWFLLCGLWFQGIYACKRATRQGGAPNALPPDSRLPHARKTGTARQTLFCQVARHTTLPPAPALQFTVLHHMTARARTFR